VSESGDTSTSQLSQHALSIRFLTRAQSEVAQMRACLPEEPMALEPPAIAHIERLAHKLASGAEAFGFKEIDAICGAIELMTQPGPRLSARERIALCMRLADRMSALSIYVEYELAEKEAKFVPEDVLPMSLALPGFGAKRK
jgi:HPt (histidine-containing phosphotransfer) domain-containing protein